MPSNRTTIEDSNVILLTGIARFFETCRYARYISYKNLNTMNLSMQKIYVNLTFGKKPLQLPYLALKNRL